MLSKIEFIARHVLFLILWSLYCVGASGFIFLVTFQGYQIGPLPAVCFFVFSAMLCFLGERKMKEELGRLTGVKYPAEEEKKP